MRKLTTPARSTQGTQAVHRQYTSTAEPGNHATRRDDHHPHNKPHTSAEAPTRHGVDKGARVGHHGAAGLDDEGEAQGGDEVAHSVDQVLGGGQHLAPAGVGGTRVGRVGWGWWVGGGFQGFGVQVWGTGY